MPESLDLWARRKGIGVIGTGDFTHPAWREELKEKLIPSGDGLYTLKDDYRKAEQSAGTDIIPHFIVTGEISSIYKKNGKVRKVHNLILLPGLEQAASISHRLEVIGNLHSDGRPILGLDSRDLLEIVLEICPEAIFIPAHIWTPHFSLHGAYSGFDDISECFEDLTGHVYALETGLSSDPPMNWRLSALDRFALVSNSDAHSPANLGREANIFHTGLSYRCIWDALRNRGAKEFHGTIEFFPEEGKYHYDGHRTCKIYWKPADTKIAGGICPVCGGKITVGVLHRVETLADRFDGFVPASARHFESLVPLHEVIAASIGFTTACKKVKQKYDDLIRNLGSELFILREASLNKIEQAAGPCVAEGIRRLRRGQVDIQPGFDGEYGKIKIMDKREIEMLSGQICLINDTSYPKSPSKSKTIMDQKNSSVEAAPAPVLAGNSAPEGSEDTAKNTPVDFPFGLNREQWEAVSSAGPAIAVTAGPGTGKTNTLVCRIAYLVEKCGVHPSRITAVTFTNKAAAEMRHRLEKHFGDKRITGPMTIGTFHAICLQILTAWKDKNLTIIDESDAVSMIEAIQKELNLKISPRELLREIALLKNGITPGGEQGKSGVPAEAFARYCARLRRYGVMDYDDILLEVLERFECRDSWYPAAGGSLKNSFTHLLVDEFQDLNGVQYRLIKEWSRKSDSIFIIGDPDQSIYGFRGSDFRYFERLKKDFPALRHVRLTRNYRSTPEIIECAKSIIIRETAGGGARSLKAKRASGAGVRLIKIDNEFSEALLVVREINRIVGGIDMLAAHRPPGFNSKSPTARYPRSFSDIAVLFRTNRQAKILEHYFLKEGIPYMVAGRDEFLSERSVREAMAFFRFLLNPGDIASLMVCLKADCTDAAGRHKEIVDGYADGEKSIISLARLIEGIQPQAAEPGQPRQFMEMVQKYKAIIDQEKPAKIIESWIKDNNLSSERCMELLLQTSVMHSEMSSFIQNLMLGRDSDIVRSGGKVYTPDAVFLMTMHAAKGLEFPVVFICGVNDGLVPMRSSTGDLDLDEERRLFYVGMTRARDELILLACRAPSPFLAGIPEEQLIRESALTQKQGPSYKQATLFDKI
ncbi:MAG: UvrD-helicase domain-containing protein [Bacillota bacterium]